MNTALACVVGFVTAVGLVFVAAIVACYHEHELRHRRGQGCDICDAKAVR